MWQLCASGVAGSSESSLPHSCITRAFFPGGVGNVDANALTGRSALVEGQLLNLWVPLSHTITSAGAVPEA